MKKKEFLNYLHKASLTEESATPMYLKHLDAFCNRFAMDKDFIKTIKEYIKVLVDGNKKHKKICDGLIKKFTKEARDDY